MFGFWEFAGTIVFLIVLFAGAVTALKSRWGWFVLGLATGGIIWPLTRHRAGQAGQRLERVVLRAAQEGAGAPRVPAASRIAPAPAASRPRRPSLCLRPCARRRTH